MAALALPPKLSRMDVIFLMARNAVLGKLRLSSRLAMAIDTFVPTMRSRQCKPSLLQMIKGPQCPSIGSVASVAICTQSALMDVVLLVAVDAVIA